MLFLFHSYSFPWITQHGVRAARKLAQFSNKTYLLGKYKELVYYLFFFFFSLPEILKRVECRMWCVILIVFIHFQVLYSHKPCTDFSYHLLASSLWLHLISKLQLVSRHPAAAKCWRKESNLKWEYWSYSVWSEWSWRTMTAFLVNSGGEILICLLFQLLLKTYGGWAKDW